MAWLNDQDGDNLTWDISADVSEASDNWPNNLTILAVVIPTSPR
jgi:hypothetical protein